MLKRWSLERVQFLLSHIEDFIEDDTRELRERARQFTSQTGLEKIERLVEMEPFDPELPVKVLERMSAFFEAGLLVQRGLGEESANWWVTDLFCKGNTFHLDVKDQISAAALIPDLTPLQVRKAPASKVLPALNLAFLADGSAAEASSYLLKPTHTVVYVLISDLPAPWSASHIEAAQKLLNKSFIY